MADPQQQVADGPAPTPTIGAAPWYTSQVLISLAVSVVTGMIGLFPKFFTAIGWTSADIVTQQIQTIFQFIALVAGIWAGVARKNASMNPLTLSRTAAEAHPATAAAVQAGTRL